MLSRSSAVIVSLTSLSAGIVLGILLGRGGPVVLAQVAGTGLDKPLAALNDWVARKATLSPESSTSDAIYEVLAKQYEQFQHVNRTFELVAKAVSPSVVHIVAQKITRAEKNRRVRQFEETGSGVIIRSDRAPGLFVLTNHHVVDGSEPGQDSRAFARLAARSWPAKSGLTARPISRSSSSTATTCRRRGWATATRPRSERGSWHWAARLA